MTIAQAGQGVTRFPQRRRWAEIEVPYCDVIEQAPVCRFAKLSGSASAPKQYKVRGLVPPLVVTRRAVARADRQILDLERVALIIGLSGADFLCESRS